MTASSFMRRSMRVRRLVPLAAILALQAACSRTSAPPSAHAGHETSASTAISINLKALLHNSWDSAYRSPFGAVPAGTPVVLRLRTAHTGASSVVLYLHASDRFGKAGATSHLMMKRAPGRKYDLWTTTVTPPAIGVYTYAFQIKGGKNVAWYTPTVGRTGGVGQASKGNTEPGDAYRITAYDPGFKAPPWATDMVIYQIFPDRFSDGDSSNDRSVMDPQYDGTHPVIHTRWSDTPLGGSDFFGGDLQGIIDKLPYLKNLGVNTIYLNPIFLAPSNHKYDTSDYFKIDPHFGTLQTFQNLLQAAHSSGIHVILDGVFNHTGSDSVYFNRYGHFPDVGADQSKASPYYPWYTFTSWPTGYETFAGVDSLPQLKETDAVKDFIFRKPDSVAQHWLAQGANGWRLDASQLKSGQWWQEFRTAIKAKYPDDILIAEDTAGPVDPTPVLMGDEFDGFMNYNFRDAILSFFTKGVAGSGGSTARSFVNNLMAMVQDYPLPATLSSMNLVDSHDTERILNDLNGNKAELKVVAAFQMAWLGAPTIYYGDETGQTGGQDPEDRRTFPWDHQDTDLQAYYRKLIAIRTANGVLRDGSILPLMTDNTHRVVAFLRTAPKRHAVIVLNDGSASRTVAMKVPGVANGTTLTDALSDTTVTVSKGSLSIRLDPHSIRILIQPATSG